MTREEALKSFEEENKDFEKIFERYGYQMSPEEVSAVKEALERNKVAISALSENKWIPVSERLPKEGETVLVCYRTQGGIAQSVCEWFDMPNRGIVWSTLSERKPIAWQPLPEPYKKGGE